MPSRRPRAKIYGRVPSQIKLMTGGGAASLYDPLDVTEFFESRFARPQAAEDLGTYVMVHVYNPKGIARALKAGVRSIEHGHLIDEPTMQLLADSGAWLSMQAFCRGGQHSPLSRPASQAPPNMQRYGPCL